MSHVTNQTNLKKEEAAKKIYNDVSLYDAINKLKTSDTYADRLKLFEILFLSLKGYSILESKKILNDTILKASINNPDVLKDIRVVAHAAFNYRVLNVTLKFSFLDVNTIQEIIRIFNKLPDTNKNSFKNKIKGIYPSLSKGDKTVDALNYHTKIKAYLADIKKSLPKNSINYFDTMKKNIDKLTPNQKTDLIKLLKKI